RLWKDQNALGAHATDLQLAKLQERSNALLRKVEHRCQVQLLYMSMVSRLRTSETTSAEIAREEKMHETNLWLPSELKHTAEL
ncbi:uncharacterized protein HD556DRAFT_1212984, partial [Suillus plorans]